MRMEPSEGVVPYQPGGNYVPFAVHGPTGDHYFRRGVAKGLRGEMVRATSPAEIAKFPAAQRLIARCIARAVREKPQFMRALHDIWQLIPRCVVKPQRRPAAGFEDKRKTKRRAGPRDAFYAILAEYGLIVLPGGAMTSINSDLRLPYLAQYALYKHEIREKREAQSDLRTFLRAQKVDVPKRVHLKGQASGKLPTNADEELRHMNTEQVFDYVHGDHRPDVLRAAYADYARYEVTKAFEFVQRKPRNTRLASSHGEITEGDDMPPRKEGAKKTKAHHAMEIHDMNEEHEGQLDALKEQIAELMKPKEEPEKAKLPTVHPTNAGLMEKPKILSWISKHPDDPSDLIPRTCADPAIRRWQAGGQLVGHQPMGPVSIVDLLAFQLYWQIYILKLILKPIWLFFKHLIRLLWALFGHCPPWVIEVWQEFNQPIFRDAVVEYYKSERNWFFGGLQRFGARALQDAILQRNRARLNRRFKQYCLRPFKDKLIAAGWIKDVPVDTMLDLSEDPLEWEHDPDMPESFEPECIDTAFILRTAQQRDLFESGCVAWRMVVVPQEHDVADEDVRLANLKQVTLTSQPCYAKCLFSRVVVSPTLQGRRYESSMVWVGRINLRAAAESYMCTVGKPSVDLALSILARNKNKSSNEPEHATEEGMHASHYYLARIMDALADKQVALKVLNRPESKPAYACSTGML